MRKQSYLTYHMQDPFDNWNLHLARAAAAGFPFRSIKVFHPENWREVKAASPTTHVVYRPWVDKLGQGRWVQMALAGNADQAAHEFIDTWIDSVKAYMPDGDIESINEEYPTGDLTKLRAMVAFDMAYIRALAQRLPNNRAVVFTAAVGNPGWNELTDTLPLAALAAQHGAAFGYHGYHPVKDGVSGVDLESAKTHLHLRFEGMDAYYRDNGYYLRWFIGEGGAMGVQVLDPPPGGNWGMSVVNGWKYSGVWNGNIDKYIADLRLLDLRLAETTVAKQGRLEGLAVFTSRPGNDPAWYKFNLIGGDAEALANLVAAGVEVDDEPPPPPPPEEECKGLPRVDYRRELWVLTDGMSEADETKVFKEARKVKLIGGVPIGRYTVGWSFDDAGIGDLSDKNAVIWNLDESRQHEFTDWYAKYYPGTKVSFRHSDELPDEE